MNALPERDEPRPGNVPVALPPPVRERLVQLASDVVGGMDADEVPGPLRPIARFTPAKRVRMGAVALAAAIDADDDFRDRLAGLVVEAGPQLADAVRAGRSMPASDPYDAAVVAYLTRPPGWQLAVSDAQESWAVEHAGRAATDEQIADLQGEVARLRAQVKEQARDHASRLREAADAAAEQAAHELTRLRNTLRERTAEAREARAALDQGVADVRRDLERQLADHRDAADSARAELAKAAERIAALERDLGAGRRDARVERQIDDSRLRLLLDTVTDAAAGLRRELALPAGTIRPGDTVPAATAASAARELGDVGGLDRLLDLPQVHVIVDGYNVTKTGYPDLALADQRTRLISAMAALRSRAGVEVTVAFDGGRRPPAQPPAPRGVRVLFSAPDELADDLIRRLVAAEPPGRVVLVVTSDRAVVTDVRAAGAWTAPSAVLLRRLTK